MLHLSHRIALIPLCKGILLFSSLPSSLPNLSCISPVTRSALATIYQRRPNDLATIYQRQTSGWHEFDKQYSTYHIILIHAIPLPPWGFHSSIILSATPRHGAAGWTARRLKRDDAKRCCRHRRHAPTACR